MKLNLMVLKKSRKPVTTGDVFVFQMVDGVFRYGRVINPSAKAGMIDDCILLYIYKGASKIKGLPPEFTPQDLLIPPLFTDLAPWKQGYFENIAHGILEKKDTLPVHCFYNPPFQKYVNEHNVELPGKIDPCGIAGFSGIRSIDDKISEALDIPLAPD